MDIFEAHEMFSEFIIRFSSFLGTEFYHFWNPIYDGILAYWPFFTILAFAIVFYGIKRLIAVFNGLF